MRRRPLPLAAIAAVLLVTPAPAAAADSAKLGKRLCETRGGGGKEFADIPDFPGERIDRRLLRDVAWLRERFKIFVWDGYSTDRAHQRNGEHPIGLALDIVPDFANGGDWGRINALARWAEPRQNRPRSPFRWVGYKGDKRHGPGDHLHLSWNHSPTKPKRVAGTVQTILCPKP